MNKQELRQKAEEVRERTRFHLTVYEIMGENLALMWEALANYVEANEQG